MKSIIGSIMTQEEFTDALMYGMETPAFEEEDIRAFGDRLIAFINGADNDYFCGWDHEVPNQIVVDVKNIELCLIALEPGVLIFLQSPNGSAEDRPLDYGRVAEGAMLHCLIEIDKAAVVEEIDPKEEALQKAREWLTKRGIKPIGSA